MKKQLLYYFSVFVLLTFSGCLKSKPETVDNPYGLPSATQQGRGVFACRMNGLKRVAKNSIFSQGGRIASDSVTVFASFGNLNYFESLAVIVYGKVLTGVRYSLNDTQKTKIFYGTDSTCAGVSFDVYNIDKASGTITFSKIDSVNKIISGKFSFTVPIEGCDSLHFTDGRFDIGY